MKHLLFDGDVTDNLDTAILIKRLNKSGILKYYIEPTGLDKSRFVAFDLKYDTKSNFNIDHNLCKSKILAKRTTKIKG